MFRAVRQERGDGAVVVGGGGHHRGQGPEGGVSRADAAVEVAAYDVLSGEPGEDTHVDTGTDDASQRFDQLDEVTVPLWASVAAGPEVR
ncbi:hypothetical protein [Streptomyces sp. NBC_01530]|uniref:hypothetical protein n=1 Tax=Streptomyces sp. NBC_01530 TaxID=2903895 RepID=UPI00386C37ED